MPYSNGPGDKRKKQSEKSSKKYKKDRKKKERTKLRKHKPLCQGPDAKKCREKRFRLFPNIPKRKPPTTTSKKPLDKIVLEKDVTETKPTPSVTERDTTEETVYSQTIGGPGGSKSKKVYEGKASEYDAEKAGKDALRKPGVSKERLIEGEKAIEGREKEKMVFSTGGKGYRITETRKSSVAPSGEKTLISSRVKHTDKDVVKYDAKKDKVTVEKAEAKKKHRKNIKRRVQSKRKASRNWGYR